MKYVTLLLLIVACSQKGNPAAPKIDPSVLVVNLTGDNVKLIWATDAGIDTVIIAPRTTHCERWLQSFDSLYTKVVDSSTSHPGAYADVITPWVHFSQYPDYFQLDTVMVAPDGQNILITNRLADAEC